MSKKKIKPTFIHHQIDGEETCIGEFHHGSASNKKILTSGKGIKLFLTDPPYNLGFDYGEVTDSQPEEDYHQMMEEIFDSCYEAADDDAHLFIIHYPQDMAKMWPRLTKKWKFHQWINWNYPANFGHSSKKWTNASRTILWLIKGEPEFFGERVVQPYRNPTDSRIKKLIHEEGKIGTNLYNWWQVNLCKNVSKDKKEYSNQIPESLLERIILSTTNFGDLVADPFSGTFSTSRTALRLGRRAWGCDLNREVVKWRPTADEYTHEPDIPAQQYDKEYPFYKLQEAGMTEAQFEKVAVHLVENAKPEELAKAPGIGIKKAREFVKNLRGIKSNNATLFDFTKSNSDEIVEDINFKISVPSKMLEDQTKMTKASKEIRLAKINKSINWESGKMESKVFTDSGDSIGDVSLSYGKPGKYYPKKLNDMRPRISSNKNWFPPSDQIHVALSLLWNSVPKIAKEINSILVRLMWCVDFEMNKQGDYVLSLPPEIEERLNIIDLRYRNLLDIQPDLKGKSLKDIILMTEGIAHTDDVITHDRNKGEVKGSAGRILAIKTLMWIGKRNADSLKSVDFSSSQATDKLLVEFSKTVTELARTGMKTINQNDLFDYVHVDYEE